MTRAAPPDLAAASVSWVTGQVVVQDPQPRGELSECDAKRLHAESLASDRPRRHRWRAAVAARRRAAGALHRRPADRRPANRRRADGTGRDRYLFSQNCVENLGLVAGPDEAP